MYFILIDKPPFICYIERFIWMIGAYDLQNGIDNGSLQKMNSHTLTTAHVHNYMLVPIFEHNSRYQMHPETLNSFGHYQIFIFTVVYC